MAALIEWSNMLSVGVREMDTQHQQLIAIINHLNDLHAGSHSTEETLQVLKAMMDYTEQHFSYEAGLMAEIQYADTPGHQHGHEGFIRKVNELTGRAQAGHAPLPEEFLLFLRDWWITHILHTDREFALALNAAGIR